MIENLRKNTLTVFVYVFYTSYIFIKSMFFYKYQINLTDYLTNFKSADYYIMELLPIYLIILFLVFKDDNIYYNYRLIYRSSIVKKQYKNIIVHAVIFVFLNFFISIFLFNGVYNFLGIHPINYYVSLGIIHTLGYVLVSSSVLLLNQISKFKNINSFLLVYFLFSIEEFILYENVLNEKIPIIISWIFVDMNLFLKIGVLFFINIALYKIVCNKSLNREFL